MRVFELSSTSQVSALAWKREKHVPIALPRQHKGMFDWAAASVRRRRSSSAERSLRSHTLHRELLFPLLPFSLPRSLLLSVTSRLLILLLLRLLLPFMAATCSGIIAWLCEITLRYSRRPSTPSVCGCRVRACLVCVCWSHFKKLSNLKHHRHLSDCPVLGCVAWKKLSKHVNHPASCVKHTWWSHWLVSLPRSGEFHLLNSRLKRFSHLSCGPSISS